MPATTPQNETQGLRDPDGGATNLYASSLQHLSVDTGTGSPQVVDNNFELIVYEGQMSVAGVATANTTTNMRDLDLMIQQYFEEGLILLHSF